MPTVKKHIVIITGNPKYITDNQMATDFYMDLKNFLESNNFTVEFDPGVSYTRPNIHAYAWIGHSKGSDRLRFATKQIITIATGYPEDKSAINHPKDDAAIGKVPGKYHFTLSPTMKKEFLKRLKV